MGERLKNIDINDSLFDVLRKKPKGIVGGCFCCSNHLHIEYDSIDILPVAKVNGEDFSVLVCDQCEEDAVKLRHKGLKEVSFDILYYIQVELNEIISNQEEITEELRIDTIFRLYKKYEKRLINE